MQHGGVWAWLAGHVTGVYPRSRFTHSMYSCVSFISRETNEEEEKETDLEFDFFST